MQNKHALALRGGAMFASSPDARLLTELRSALTERGPVPEGTAAKVFAMESIADSDIMAIEQAATNLQSTLSSVVGMLGFETKDIFVQESAAVQGGMVASAAQSFLSRQISFPTESTKDRFVVPGNSAPNYLGHRSNLFAMEAFDNRETRNAMLYTMAYNYSCARQDDFGETIWPTLTLAADQVGFGIVVNRLTIHRGVSHTVDGKVVQFNKVDLMRAAADHTVLHKKKNLITPHVRPDAVDKFVDAAVIAPYTIDIEGENIKTAPLKVGVEIGLMGLGQTDAMLDGGLMNQTDTLDPAVQLEAVYAQIGADVVKFNVYGLPAANFTYAPQGMDKQRNLQMTSKAIFLTKGATQVDGSALSDLAPIVTKSLTVEVELVMTGTLNTEFGSIRVFGNQIGLVKVLDADKVQLGSTNADVQDLAGHFANAKIVGYDVRAYRTNMNMRERGDFIDRTSFTQLYEVPLLSPVTAQRPQNTDGQQDAGDFEALVTTTRFRLQNDAVTAIFDSVARLQEHIKPGVSIDDLPSAVGASRFHVKPVIFTPDPIDVTKLVDSLTSGDRLKDLQAGIVNLLRDYAFNMYIQSEYPSAQQALGMTGPTTVIIATDPKIHRYIMLDGDLRTLTEKFNIRVVSTIDKRFTNKLFMTFGVFDETRNQAPNLLNWGNLIWAPEVVMSASVPRGESMSRETIVQPRYVFVNHLPIAAMFDFTNLSDVFEKLELNVHQV